MTRVQPLPVTRKLCIMVENIMIDEHIVYSDSFVTNTISYYTKFLMIYIRCTRIEMANRTHKQHILTQ